MLRIGAELGAERAADVRGDHADLPGIKPEQAGQAGPGALGALIGYPCGQPPVVAPGGRGRAGLHGGRRDALVDDRVPRHGFALVEQVRIERGGVAEPGRDVGAGFLEQQHLAGDGRGQVDDRGQRVIVDVDEF